MGGICKQCNSGCFEDEHHFMFEYKKKHDEERIILYREYGRTITDLYELLRQISVKTHWEVYSRLYDETVIVTLS